VASARPLSHLALAALLGLALLLSGCRINLYDKLAPAEANEMLAALAGAGIDASKRTPDDKTWMVEVDQGDAAAAIEVLRSQGLPHPRYANVGEVFRKQGLVSTPTEERIRFIYAVSQELSETLTQIDGVVLARVHVVLPANDPLSDKIKPSSASVFIKHRVDANLLTLQPAVKNLVMRGIEGLSNDNIALTFLPAERLARPDALQMTRVLGLDLSVQSLPRLWLLAGMAALFLFSVLALVVFRYRAPVRDDLAVASQALAKTWRTRVRRKTGPAHNDPAA
jgi:type III secretion protein J